MNWEWLIHCAIASKKDVIVVTRDTDYGINFDGGFLLNDWLRLEFRERVGKKRKILITDRLADAFKRVAISVSAAAEAEEKALVAEPPGITSAALRGETVAMFARELHLPIALLIEQLLTAGVVKAGASDPITDSDKATLLDYLRKMHGGKS